MTPSTHIGYFLFNTNLGNYKGHSINVSKTIESMRAAGLDIRIVVPKYNKQDDLKIILKEYTLTDEIPVKQLWVPGRSSNRWSFIYFSLAAWLWIAVQILMKKCQFVYIRSEYFFPIVFLCKVTKVPLFYEIHRIGLHARAQYFKTYIARNSRGVVVLTDVLKEIFSDDNKNIHVEHDAVNFAHFALSIEKKTSREILGWKKDVLTMVYTGSVQKIKGVEMVVENAKFFPEIEFYIIGRISPEMSHYMECVPENVHVLGVYTHNELPQFLMAADVLLLPQPSGPQSQSPMKLFEYLATGRPIISSSLPNIMEVLPKVNTTFSSDDSDSYRKAVQKYADSYPSIASELEENKATASNHTYERRGYRIASFVTSGLDNTK